MTRLCKKCEELKRIDEFVKNKNCRYGCEHTCRECAANRSELYRQNNKSSISVRMKEYYHKNRKNILLKTKERKLQDPEKKRASDAKSYQKNKGKRQEWSKGYYVKNKDKIYERTKNWRSKNKAKRNVYEREYYLASGKRALVASKAWAKKDRDNLGDHYVGRLIKAIPDMENVAITPEMVSEKRADLKLLRTVRDMEEKYHEFKL